MAVPEVARNLMRMREGWSAEDAAEFIATSRWKGYPGFRLAITRNGTCIGGLGFGGTPLGIGYFLAPDHWGQGVATEALSAFIPELFERFPVNRLEADHFEDNPASGHILRKFGFTETGRDMGTSLARLEPAPTITYALHRDGLRVPV